MIRLLLIIFGFFLLAGATVGGLYYWGIDPLAKLGIGQAKLEANRPVMQQSYVDLGLLVVPIIQNREVRTQAEMVIRLAVKSSDRDFVAMNLPRLQAGFLEDLLGFLPILLRDDGELRPVPIRRRLQAVSNRIVGPGRVNDIVIEHAAIK